VPRLYLRAFSREEQILLRTRGANLDEVRNISRTAYTNEFYSFSNGGVKTSMFEEWLGKHVEDPAAPALKAVLGRQWPPSDEQRQVLSTLIAFQMLRTPLIRGHMLQVRKHITPVVWSSEMLARASKDLDLSDEGKLALIDAAAANTPEELAQVGDKRMALRSVLRVADWLTPVLAGRGWTLHAGKVEELITSDNPVARFYPGGEIAGFEGIAPGHAQLQLPLGPSMLLTIEPEGVSGDDEAVELTPAMVALSNARQARGAERVALRHPGTPWPAQLMLGPHPPALPQPTITRSIADDAEPTPMVYPPVNNPAVAALLETLGAEETA
jgi:hypothetical protein